MTNSTFRNANNSNENNASIEFKDFTVLVKQLMEAKNITRAELIEGSCLSKVTVSRILRNTNNKGSGYTPTMNVVSAICFGLKATDAEAEELLLSAFPQWKVGRKYFSKEYGIYDANSILDDNGLSPIGNTEL